MTEQQFIRQMTGRIAFCALDGNDVIGFLTMRNPNDTLDELRFGFVIVSPDKRGHGFGKAMLQLALRYARLIYQAKTVSLGVFQNNPSAYHCYKAVGFVDVITAAPETYRIMGEDWPCI